MAEEAVSKTSVSAPATASSGPGSGYEKFLEMEQLLEKLKVLQVEEDFIKKSAAFKMPSRHYFALQTNPGEQFFLFSSLAAWLIRKGGNSAFEMPQEHDDPNATITNILNEFRNTGSDVDFPPNKLKSGAGEHCIYVLSGLADAAMSGSAFNWQQPLLVVEEPDDTAVAVDQAEITAEQFDVDEDPEMADDDDDAGFLDLRALQHGVGSQPGDGASEQQKEVLRSDTDALAWKLEVERVMPSLKITIRQDAKDWRAHLDQMHQYRATIGEALQAARAQLDRLSGDIGRGMEKIASREKYLNSQLESLLVQLRAARDRFAESREKYREASGGVTERSRALAQLTDELEQTKQEMEERGSSLTDGAPLVRVKQAVIRLQEELVGMDVEMGVIEQALLQAQLRDRSYIQDDMHAQPRHSVF